MRTVTLVLCGLACLDPRPGGGCLVLWQGARWTAYSIWREVQP